MLSQLAITEAKKGLLSSLVRSYTTAELLSLVSKLPGFTKFPSNDFIVGVRSKEDRANGYDDKFYIFNAKLECFCVLPGTTNPGTTILIDGFKAYSKKGAAVLVASSCYYDLWNPVFRAKRGFELQQFAACDVLRDGNNNDRSGDSGIQERGVYGINFHTNTFKDYQGLGSVSVNTWSAGCQVTNARRAFRELVERWYNENKSAAKAGKKGNKISYFLLDEHDN